MSEPLRFSEIRDHQLDARDACLEHGLECPANCVVGSEFGFDPFR